MKEISSMRSRLRLLVYGVLTLAACAAVAACGSSSTSTSSSSSGKTSSSSDTAGIAAAQTVVKQAATPTAWPVDKPLLKKPTGRFAFLDCAEPTCGDLVPIFDAAAKIMGVPDPLDVQSGASASGLQSALSTILADKPAALILPAVNLGDLGDSVSQFNKAGIPISAGGIMAGPAQGIQVSIPGRNNFTLEGKILADWAITKVGAHANIVFYYTPDLDFSPVIESALKAEVSKNCPSCSVRTVPIPATEDGSTAPATIVADLKSNASTNVAVFANLETAIGLPAQLKAASIHIPIAGGSPLPQSIQDMQNGYIDAAVTFDYGALAFTAMDAAARLATHEPITSGEAAGVLQTQLITKANLTGAHVGPGGYSPTPGFAKIFAKLWANAKPTG
jgi:ribose transport system substrate-binding protein